MWRRASYEHWIAGLDPCHNIHVPSVFQSIFGSKIQHFQVFHDKKNYWNAKAECESKNYRLATIRTMEAYQFLIDSGKRTQIFNYVAVFSLGIWVLTRR